MSKITLAVNLEALEKRIEKLEEYIDSQVTPRFDDVQDGQAAHRDLLIERIDSYFSCTEKQISEMKQNLVQVLAELRVRIQEKVQAEIKKTTVEEIAEALTKRILVTRAATRDELKNDENVLKVRPASREELHQN